MDLNSVVGSSGLDKFLQEKKRITVRNKKSCQVFFLLGDNRGQRLEIIK